MELSGVAAVVTGGASGLGEAAARALSNEGVKVTIFDLNAEKGEQVAGEIGGFFAKVDVTDDVSVDAGFAAAREVHGQERILINCAGRGNSFKTAGRKKETSESYHFPIDEFERIVKLNLVGTFRCIAKSAKGMLDLEPLKDGERGSIISTASVAAQDGQIGQAAYASSKNGIAGLTLPVARDLMRDGIRVNAILPGIFNTPLFATIKQEMRDALAATVPFPKRLGEPEEFASLALELCRNCYMNGENIRLDGALRMAPR